MDAREGCILQKELRSLSLCPAYLSCIALWEGDAWFETNLWNRLPPFFLFSPGIPVSGSTVFCADLPLAVRRPLLLFHAHCVEHVQQVAGSSHSTRFASGLVVENLCTLQLSSHPSSTLRVSALRFELKFFPSGRVYDMALRACRESRFFVFFPPMPLAPLAYFGRSRFSFFFNAFYLCFMYDRAHSSLCFQFCFSSTVQPSFQTGDPAFRNDEEGEEVPLTAINVHDDDADDVELQPLPVEDDTDPLEPTPTTTTPPAAPTPPPTTTTPPAPPTSVVRTEEQKAVLRAKLTKFYGKYNPSMLEGDHLEKVLDSTIPDRELFKRLWERYVKDQDEDGDGDSHPKIVGERRRPTEAARVRIPRGGHSVAERFSDNTSALLVPVSITMFVVVWAVTNFTPISEVSQAQPMYLVYKEGSDETDGSKFGGALLNALIIVGFFAVVTTLMVVLYKYRYEKKWGFFSHLPDFASNLVVFSGVLLKPHQISSKICFLSLIFTMLSFNLKINGGGFFF